MTWLRWPGRARGCEVTAKLGVVGLLGKHELIRFRQKIIRNAFRAQLPSARHMSLQPLFHDGNFAAGGEMRDEVFRRRRSGVSLRHEASQDSGPRRGISGTPLCAVSHPSSIDSEFQCAWQIRHLAHHAAIKRSAIYPLGALLPCESMHFFLQWQRQAGNMRAQRTFASVGLWRSTAALQHCMRVLRVP